MKLQYTCTSCRQPSNFTPKFANRGEMQMQLEDEVNTYCTHCMQENILHLNKIQGIVDIRIVLAALLLAILVSIFLWNTMGLIVGLALIIPFVAWAYERNQTRQFNQYRIRKK